jgi:hypothetical protein
MKAIHQFITCHSIGYDGLTSHGVIDVVIGQIKYLNLNVRCEQSGQDSWNFISNDKIDREAVAILRKIIDSLVAYQIKINK